MFWRSYFSNMLVTWSQKQYVLFLLRSLISLYFCTCVSFFGAWEYLRVGSSVFLSFITFWCDAKKRMNFLFFFRLVLLTLVEYSIEYSMFIYYSQSDRTLFSSACAEHAALPLVCCGSFAFPSGKHIENRSSAVAEFVYLTCSPTTLLSHASWLLLSYLGLCVTGIYYA